MTAPACEAISRLRADLRRSVFGASRCRVNSFSFASRSLRAASQASRDTTGGSCSSRNRRGRRTVTVNAIPPRARVPIIRLDGLMSVYDFTVRTADGSTQDLGQYSGQPLLIVNVASKCGLTPQYEGLEALYRDTRDRGLRILGFPCNQFGGQEPGTDADIQEFCSTNYAVTFPVFGKIDVNGEQADPLYAYLRAEAPGDFGPGHGGLLRARPQHPARGHRHRRDQVELHEVPGRPGWQGHRPVRADRHPGGDPGRHRGPAGPLTGARSRGLAPAMPVLIPAGSPAARSVRRVRTAERVSADKLRGGFYSPASLVRACLDRVSALAGGQDGLRVLEPSAGDGAFVRGLAGHEMARRVAGLTAVEINAAEAARCQAALDAAPFGGAVIPGSVLGTARPRPGRYDIAVGNPPFVRFQFLSGDDRRGALGVARDSGLPITGVSNLWIPVLLAALHGLRPGGAFAFLVPSECFTGISARSVRTWLISHTEHLRADLFPPGSFPGVLQEVVVLSGRMAPVRPALLRVVEHAERVGAAGTPRSWSHRIDLAAPTWTRYLLSPAQLAALDQLTQVPGFQALSEVARLSVSTVTGANTFFSVDDGLLARYDLAPWALPLLPRIRHAAGLTFGKDDHDDLATAGLPTLAAELRRRPPVSRRQSGGPQLPAGRPGTRPAGPVQVPDPHAVVPGPGGPPGHPAAVQAVAPLPPAGGQRGRGGDHGHDLPGHHARPRPGPGSRPGRRVPQQRHPAHRGDRGPQFRRRRAGTGAHRDRAAGRPAGARAGRASQPPGPAGPDGGPGLRRPHRGGRTPCCSRPSRRSPRICSARCGRRAPPCGSGGWTGPAEPWPDDQADRGGQARPHGSDQPRT